jgi:hypothetical protein
MGSRLYITLSRGRKINRFHTAVEHVKWCAWEIDARRSSHPDFSVHSGSETQAIVCKVTYRRDPSAWPTVYTCGPDSH